MKFISIVFVFIICASGSPNAGNIPKTDADALSDILISCLTTLFSNHDIQSDTAISLAFSPLASVSEHTRKTAEAFLTDKGLVISGNADQPQARVTISLSGPRIIIRVDGKSFTRTMSLSTHVSHHDSRGELRWADSCTESAMDTFPKSQLEATDDSEQFWIGLKRIIIGRTHDTIRMISFILVSGVLAFFAFQR